MNKKQTIPKIWKILEDLNMSWHRKANCNFENPSVCFLLARANSNLCVFCRKKIKKFWGWVNPQIQARRAKDVDVVLHSEYWVLI